jgi:predicted O-methyltransferase YrrM
MKYSDFEKLMDSIATREKDLVWKLPKVPKKPGTVFKDPYMYIRPWSIPKTTGQFLHDLVEDLRPQAILELGMSTAYSTLWLAHAAANYGGTVFSIEKMEFKYELAKENIKESGLTNIETFFDDIQVIVDAWMTPLDFIFMDADKQRYAQYLSALEPYCTEEVIIIVDNAGNFADRMKSFFSYLEEHKEIWTHEFINLDNGLLKIQRTK